MDELPPLSGSEEQGFHLAAVWNRRLSANQIKQLRIDPWRLFWRDHKGRGSRQGGQSIRHRRRNFIWRVK